MFYRMYQGISLIHLSEILLFSYGFFAIFGFGGIKK